MQDTAPRTEAFRRGGVRRFVRVELFDEDLPAGMRYDGWYACRPLGHALSRRARRGRGTGDRSGARLVPTEAARRRAALLQQLFEVDPLRCPTSSQRGAPRERTSASSPDAMIASAPMFCRTTSTDCLNAARARACGIAGQNIATSPSRRYVVSGLAADS